MAGGPGRFGAIDCNDKLFFSPMRVASGYFEVVVRRPTPPNSGFLPYLLEWKPCEHLLLWS